MKTTELDYLKILYALAWVDSKLQEEELLFFEEVENLLELTDKEKQIADEWKKVPFDQDELNKIDFSSFSLDQKKHILLLVISVAKADGIITGNEEKFVENIKALLGLGEISESDLVEEIKDSLDLYGALDIPDK